MVEKCTKCGRTVHPFSKSCLFCRDLVELRDNFAMAAMVGFSTCALSAEQKAQRAYELADAMLKERDKR